MSLQPRELHTCSICGEWSGGQRQNQAYEAAEQQEEIEQRCRGRAGARPSRADRIWGSGAGDGVIQANPAAGVTVPAHPSRVWAQVGPPCQVSCLPTPCGPFSHPSCRYVYDHIGGDHSAVIPELAASVATFVVTTLWLGPCDIVYLWSVLNCFGLNFELWVQKLAEHWPLAQMEVGSRFRAVTGWDQSGTGGGGPVPSGVIQEHWVPGPEPSPFAPVFARAGLRMVGSPQPLGGRAWLSCTALIVPLGLTLTEHGLLSWPLVRTFSDGRPGYRSRCLGGSGPSSGL